MPTETSLVQLPGLGIEVHYFVASPNEIEVYIAPVSEMQATVRRFSNLAESQRFKDGLEIILRGTAIRIQHLWDGVKD